MFLHPLLAPHTCSFIKKEKEKSVYNWTWAPAAPEGCQEELLQCKSCSLGLGIGNLAGELLSGYPNFKAVGSKAHRASPALSAEQLSDCEIPRISRTSPERSILGACLIQKL